MEREHKWWSFDDGHVHYVGAGSGVEHHDASVQSPEVAKRLGHTPEEIDTYRKFKNSDYTMPDFFDSEHGKSYLKKAADARNSGKAVRFGIARTKEGKGFAFIDGLQGKAFDAAKKTLSQHKEKFDTIVHDDNSGQTREMSTEKFFSEKPKRGASMIAQFHETFEKLPVNVKWHSPDGGFGRIWMKHDKGWHFFQKSRGPRGGDWNHDASSTHADLSDADAGRELPPNHPAVRQIIKQHFMAESYDGLLSSLVEEIDPISRGRADPFELQVGVQVEFEHTTDRKAAERIALQHIAEDPSYYWRMYKAGLATKEELGDQLWDACKEMWGKDNVLGTPPKGIKESMKDRPLSACVECGAEPGCNIDCKTCMSLHESHGLDGAWIVGDEHFEHGSEEHYRSLYYHPKHGQTYRDKVKSKYGPEADHLKMMVDQDLRWEMMGGADKLRLSKKGNEHLYVQGDQTPENLDRLKKHYDLQSFQNVSWEPWSKKQAVRGQPDTENPDTFTTQGDKLHKTTDPKQVSKSDVAKFHEAKKTDFGAPGKLVNHTRYRRTDAYKRHIDLFKSLPMDAAVKHLDGMSNEAHPEFRTASTAFMHTYGNTYQSTREKMIKDGSLFPTKK